MWRYHFTLFGRPKNLASEPAALFSGLGANRDCTVHSSGACKLRNLCSDSHVGGLKLDVFPRFPVSWNTRAYICHHLFFHDSFNNQMLKIPNFPFTLGWDFIYAVTCTNMHIVVFFDTVNAMMMIFWFSVCCGLSESIVVCRRRRQYYV